ncbi:MAG: dihydroorotase [Myxococcales bacterium]|nr:dihydroorotase [Myxococcales bacterium]
MKRTLIRGVRVFDPGAGIDARDRSVLIEGPYLRYLNVEPDVLADRVVDGHGLVLCPGFIDLRSHLGEPGFTRQESIATGVAAAAAGGFTTVVMMPTTEPTIDRVEVVELILSRARAAGSTRVLPAGALSLGRKGESLAEMGNLSAAGCVLFTDADRSVRDSQLLRYAMETAYDLRMPIATHAEDEWLSLGGVMNEGEVSARLGLRGSPSAAEAVGVARDLALAELTGARLHLGHVSTAGAAELIRQAKRRGVRVTAEVSPLHLILTDEATLGYNTAAKLVPPLRTQVDVDAVVRALADGTIDAVATDHQGQTELDKNVEFDRAASGSIGLETAFGVVLELVEQGRLTFERAVAVLTRGPAQVLGRRDLGRLIANGTADLVLVDPHAAWEFQLSSSFSRSRNTPLSGRMFPGRVVWSMARGEVTFDILR